jgi:peptidoglycan/LPS O-acetylase OafA/YrhL
MTLGGIIAYQKVTIRNNYVSNILSTIGVVAILITIYVIDEDSLFPGFWALVPTLSACAIILAGNSALINNYILSSKPFVFMGKISYPLYLWHWPSLVVSRI